MKSTRFMRIPFFVTGYKVTDDNLDAIAKWCEGHVVRANGKAFVRVPVDRPTNKRQTEAHPETWVILSMQRGNRSFKVYTEEWLNRQFFTLPDEPVDEGIPDDELGDETSFETAPGAANLHAIPLQNRTTNVTSRVATT